MDSDQQKLNNLEQELRIIFEMGMVHTITTSKGFLNICLKAGLPNNTAMIANYFRQNKVKWPYTFGIPQTEEVYMDKMNKVAIQLLTGE